MEDLVTKLHSNELFQAAIKDLDESTRAGIVKFAEDHVRQLESALKASLERRDVVSTEQVEPV